MPDKETDKSAENWERIVKLLKNEAPFEGHESLNLWFANSKALHMDDGVLKIEVPNSTIKDWIDHNYLKKINNLIKANFPSNFEITFIAKEFNHIPEPEIKIETQEAVINISTTNLDNRYTFDNFIQGDSNKFACAVAVSVSDNPGTRYNPLFIYGGVGLGKTHILNAIGNKIIHGRKLKQILLTSAEMFVNELIESIGKNQQTIFRKKYRNLNVLMIDDIQSLVRWDSAQDEFFHTFNTLYSLKNQIVMTSDRPPNEIPKLHERLISRFRQGLMVEIKPPELETRIAILERYAQNNHINVEKEVLDAIARKVTDNVRVLEGALIRLSAFSSIVGKDVIDIEMAHEILKDILKSEEKVITPEIIQKKVAEFFDLSEYAIKGKKRNKSIAISRHIAMYLTREMTDLSYKEIGELFGKKDHSTVIHAIKKIGKKIQEEQSFAKEIEKIKSDLKDK
ncbi:chromosomal replication initiator protein DnaA [candidate division WOR-3 bacterium]|nr:chromosomal replication initiator protein DnaA [candidate division WOR-3 bacterium]